MVFQYAKAHSYSIVTFDSDYADLSTVKGSPPKIIWLRTGNLTTRSVSNLLLEKLTMIQQFILDEEGAILELVGTDL